MGKEKDKQTKTAPPRESDSVRQNRLMDQLGLKKEGSAKQRRRLATQQSRNHQRGGRK